MDNQKIGTGVGTGILIIIAIAIFVFAWMYEKNRTQPLAIETIPATVNIRISDDIASWKTYRSNSTTYLFKTTDWNNFDFIKNDTFPMMELQYPENWKLDSTVFSDENGDKIAEFSPGTVFLNQNQHCFDSESEISFSERNQILLNEQFKIKDITGVRRVMKIRTETGKIWFPHTYCIEDNGKAFVVSFYENAVDPVNKELYEKIISSFKFLP